MPTSTHTPKKSSRKWIVLLLVIVVIACGAAGYAFWKLRALSASAATQTSLSSAVSAEVPQPLFYPLEPFTVNLVDSPTQEERVLYVGFTLRLNDRQTEERIVRYLPAARSRLLLLLSHQHQAQLQTEQGKIALTAELKAALKPPFAPGLPEQEVADILYTTFILR